MDDHAQIANVIAALGVHVDARQWDKLLALFAPEVQLDYTSLFGGEQQSMTRAQLINSWLQLIPGFTHTTHLIAAPLISVAGDAAQASASVVAWHVIREPAMQAASQWVVRGCYEMNLNKGDHSWVITSLRLARAWTDGNPDLPRLAAERAAELRNPSAQSPENAAVRPAD